MERPNHEHIVEYLGQQFFHALYPEILMPLHSGSLTSLVKSLPPGYDSNYLCLVFMEQILSALDYLASESLIHRDLKPVNILYSPLSEGSYLFQLADFGLAHYHSLATTFCGTGYYQAPELHPLLLRVNASQIPKLDIWSLYAIIAAVHSGLKEFPPATKEYSIVLDVLKSKAAKSPTLEPMARLHPDSRTSAAHMLVLLFEGRGLTTARPRIPPIEPATEDVPQAHPSPAAQPTRAGRGNDPWQPRAATSPLIVYKPRRRALTLKQGGNPAQSTAPQLLPIRTHRDGVVKHWVQRPAAPARANARTRPPTDRKLPPKQTNLVGSPPETKFQIPGMFVD